MQEATEGVNLMTHHDRSMPEKNDEAVYIDEAGKGELDDEMLPNRGEPVPQEETGGDEPDPGAPEGAVETAAALERRVDEERS